VRSAFCHDRGSPGLHASPLDESSAPGRGRLERSDLPSNEAPTLELTRHDPEGSDAASNADSPVDASPMECAATWMARPGRLARRRGSGPPKVASEEPRQLGHAVRGKTPVLRFARQQEQMAEVSGTRKVTQGVSDTARSKTRPRHPDIGITNLPRT